MHNQSRNKKYLYTFLLPIALSTLCCSSDDSELVSDARPVVDASQNVDSTPSPDAMSAPVCTTAIGGTPRSLLLPKSEENGVFDPNLARDPATQRLWMSYSGVTGPGGSGEVSTHLSYSDDDGVTWCHQGIANPAKKVPESEQPTNIAMPEGFWNHETSAIAYDPSAPPDSRWILVWMRYLHVEDNIPDNEDRHFEHGWIAQKRSATAEGLLSAPESKLFSASFYHLLPQIETYNNMVPGGVPEKRWDSDPNLSDCVAFAEPGVISANGKLYVAMFCAKESAEHEVVLVEKSEGSWSYAGTLLTPEDALAINPALTTFNAPDIVVSDGAYRLLVSPTAGIAYLGCIEYSIDLESGSLEDSDNNGPDALSAYAASTDPDTFLTGACTYDENSSMGLVVGEAHVSAPQFRLFATGQTL